MIFDTHAHYDDKAFDEDREALLEGMPAAGIGRIVNVSSSLASCKTTLELTERHPHVYGAIGIHPSDTGELDECSFARVAEQCAAPKCVAVGEIGLDYYWEEPNPEIQKEWFARQLDLAREKKLPVIIHSRDAAKDTIDLLRGGRAEEIGGVIHCYSYSRETAREFLEMGFYFGIGGVLTFKNGRKLKEAVEYLPLDRLVLETDCPYLSPEPNRGKRNSSLNLPFVADMLARLKGIPREEAERVTWENALGLYRMKA